jgi:hypothetical protein
MSAIPPPMACKVEGCARPVSARGLCRAHYERQRMGRPLGNADITPSRVAIKEMATKHGLVRTPTYRSWCAMHTRCSNPRVPAYQRYGAVGIKVCAEWSDFSKFLRDMGARPSLQHSIDRIDGGRGYEPGNCRWATSSEQSRNRSTSRAVIRSDGTRYPTMIDAAEAIPGGNRRCIRDVCTGRQKTHLGFTWRFA